MNEINNVRPNSRFESYNPRTESQAHALQVMQQLTQQLTSLRAIFTTATNPFADGMMFVLTGGPGRGKSHLLEAVVNQIKKDAPEVFGKIYLLRQDIGGHLVAGVSERTFEGKPIILIDDLFSSKQSVHDLTQFDVERLSKLIAYIYDNRMVVIATCNFPFVSGILPVIEKHDKVGRITSRCAELISAHSGELIMDGPDYRRILAERASGQRTPTSLSLPAIKPPN